MSHEQTPYLVVILDHRTGKRYVDQCRLDKKGATERSDWYRAQGIDARVYNLDTNPDSLTRPPAT